jgi:hypothetical protein
MRSSIRFAVGILECIEVNARRLAPHAVQI